MFKRLIQVVEGKDNGVVFDKCDAHPWGKTAMEGIDGSEVDTLREALERAKKAVQSPPVETQIRDCEQILVRPPAHLEAIVEEGSKRLESLKVLQRKFQTRCQKCKGHRHRWPSCSPENFVPSCVEEMQQWVWDRQQDVHGCEGLSSLSSLHSVSQRKTSTQGPSSVSHIGRQWRER